MSTKNNHIHEWESLFREHRQFLISFAYRMTGSLAEAEDLVQETFIETADVDPKTINNHKSWLTKVCSNKSLDLLKSAYKRRETYPGVWLPDAIPETFQSPDENILTRESLSMSFLLVMQKLTPEERAVYLLNDVFEYSFKEISDFMNKTEDACRKTAQRARKAFDNQKRFNGYTPEAVNVVTNFFENAKNGNAEALMDMLSDESEFWADGGGKVSVASKEVMTDREKISKFFSALWSSKLFSSENTKQEYIMVNSRPGLVVSKLQEDGNWMFDTILSFEVEGERIARIYVQRNPDKLQALLSI